MSFVVSTSPALDARVDGTLVNYGPDILYYRDEVPVNAATNDGQITAGQNVALTGTQWLLSAGHSAVDIISHPSAGGSGQTFSVAGTATVGATLTTSGVPDDASLAWYRDSTPISGATSETYVIRAVDQGHDITCRASDPSNAIVIPAGLGTGVELDGTGQMVYATGAVDLSNTANTMWVLWQPLGADGTSMTLLAGESAVPKAHWAWYRLSSAGFWVANSLGFYRYRLPPDDNEDLVWTTDVVGAGGVAGIVATLSDGLLSSFMGKPLAGGAGNELYASQYVQDTGEWVHDDFSPSRFNFQIALGSPLGVDGRLVIGSANATDRLVGRVYAAAIWEDLLTDWDAVMATGSTAAILATDPVWCTDASVNLEVDLTGNGGDLVSSSGVDQADPLDPAVWLMGP